MYHLEELTDAERVIHDRLASGEITAKEGISRLLEISVGQRHQIKRLQEDLNDLIRVIGRAE